MSMRHRRETGDVPPAVAAHHMGYTSLQDFEAALPALLGRRFPPPDPPTGNFDLDAIKAWRKSRHPQLFPSDRLLVGPTAKDASTVVANRLARFGGG